MNNKNEPGHDQDISIKYLIDNPTLPEGVTRKYANFVRFNISGNDFYIDFLLIAPPVVSGEKPESTIVQRVILPAAVAKGLVSGLANAIIDYEENNNITLPDQRGDQPGDKIKIWTQS